MKKSKKVVLQFTALRKVSLSLQTDDDAIMIEGVQHHHKIQEYFSNLSIDELEAVLAHVRQKNALCSRFP
ncbi:MAG: hypothetical protein COT25_03070 [Candidatus Kerfeldbacteria bacterium CG08_land_8_20_14_0_20_42_7]|uniref:Uncharacterized protein n=1 Tax=Candidatus Kerfeldbacteria bacterium CG08_land_8_20_14_0_20_42_7 TaxID=2014245 RepID=A0A2H0YSG3_9BACT|nr:MAG: hypothetical protein COT25_03070 [Candidatus Kerfeldbacteria bacterium CG08_land_8_20_14_0_20_42_7]